MNRKIVFSLTAFAILCMLLLSESCSHSENGPTKISSFNDDESHKTGQNCMQCHYQGGRGEGYFKVAGSVYDSLQISSRANGIINLYTGVNGTGTLMASIQVDGKGNFYTTESIDFSMGLYPGIIGSNGDVRFMSTMIDHGACNSCHGVNNDKIWVN